MLGLRAVGYRPWDVDVHDLAAAQLLLDVVAGPGSTPIDTAFRAFLGGDRGAPDEQPAAADRDEQHVEPAAVPDLLDQLERSRALPGHHVAMVVRRDQA